MRADANGRGDVGHSQFCAQRRKRGETNGAHDGVGIGLHTANTWAKRVSALDMYPKLRVEHRVKTASGAALSLLSVALAIILFMSELREFASPDHKEHLGVDRTFSRLHSHAWHRPWVWNAQSQHPTVLQTQRLQSTKWAAGTSSSRKSLPRALDAWEMHLVPLYFNVSLLRVPCSEVRLCVMDVSGRQQLDVRHDVYKTPTDQIGRLQHHARVRYRLHQQDTLAGTNTSTDPGAGGNAPHSPQTPQTPGCNIHGRLFVSKVAGNVHFADGPAVETRGRHFHHFTRASALKFDASHILHYVSFGRPFPGRIDPLSGTFAGPSANTSVGSARYHLAVGGAAGENGGSEAESYDGERGAAAGERVGEGKDISVAAMYQYFMKVVPTLHVSERRQCAGLETRSIAFTWHTLRALVAALMRTLALNHPCGEPKVTETDSFQYSFTRAITPIITPPFESVNTLPGLYLVWDFSPFRVRITERARSWPHFIARVCAVVGGAFSISSAVDLISHRLRRTSPLPHGMLPR